MLVVALSLALLAAPQAGDDLGGGAPLEGPSPADLGVPPPEPTPPPTEEPKKKPKPKPKEPETPKPPKETPKPTTPPTAAPAPATPTTPAAAAPPVDDKTRKLRADVDAALLDLSDAKDEKRALQAKLDALAQGFLGEPQTTQDPELKPLLKLVKLRAAALAGRFDDADTALKEARAAVDAIPNKALEGPAARRLSAIVRFYAASIVEARARQELFDKPVCGSALGLKRLSSSEAKKRRKLLDDVADKYGVVARGPDKLWGRRAAFQVAALYDDVARLGLGPSSFRGITLPGPYAVDVKDTTSLFQPVLGQWLGEIGRSYAELSTAINSRDPDPVLAEQVKARAAALAQVTLPGGEPVANPWQADLHDGVIRISKRPERRNAAGRFVPLESRLALSELQGGLQKGVGTVDHAWALVGLAELAPDKVGVDDLKAALAHEDPRVVVAGLLATERVVSGKGGDDKAAALREPVTAAFATATTPADLEAKKRPFSSLQSSLHGRVERSLLALQAIAKADRAAADAIAADDRLPAVERAWIIAELSDARFAQRFDSWAWEKDERTAALAVWGGVQARGKNASYLLRPTAEGLVGCVSRAATSSVD